MNLREAIAKKIKKHLKEKVYKLYHGTNDEFKSFDPNKIGSNTEAAWNGYGFYFSDNKTEASLYGNKIINVEVELNNPIDLSSITDSSVQGSGLIKFLSKLKGFENVQIKGKPLVEIANLIDDLESDFNYNNIGFSQGTNPEFKHVWYDYNGKEYVLRNRTEDEINNKEWLRSMILSNILYQEFKITNLPIRVSDFINPYSFTQIAKENGYDGVIAQNSTSSTGNEYVVFDQKNIKILGSD